MEAAGIRKHIIMDNFISRYGSYDKCGLIRRDIYNLCCREKMKLIAKGDAETAVGIMRSRKEKDPEFFFEYVRDKEGRLKSMFCVMHGCGGTIRTTEMWSCLIARRR